MSNDPYKWYDVSSRTALERTARVNSRWFYAIACLSLLNTFLAYGGAPIRITLGLAFTQLVDGIIAALFPDYYYLSLVIDVVIAATFIGFGYLSGHSDMAAFVIGLALYLFDTLLYLALIVLGRTPMAIVAIIWHCVAAYFLWKGLRAALDLRALPAEANPGDENR